MVATSLINQLRALPLEDRQDLLEVLQESLPQHQQDELDAAHLAEAQDRWAAYKRGEVQSIPGDTVMAEIRELLASR